MAAEAQRASRRPVQRSDRARVEISCNGCGYGAVVTHLPARCPMCGGTVWSEHDRYLDPSLMRPGAGRLPEQSEV